MSLNLFKNIFNKKDISFGIENVIIKRYNPEYKVGIKEIDSQIEEILQITNNIYLNIINRDSKIVSNCLLKIINNVKKYSQAQDRILESNLGLDKLLDIEIRKHIESHEEIFSEIINKIKDSVDEHPQNIKIDIAISLNRWLSHVIKEDSKIFNEIKKYSFVIIQEMKEIS